LKTHSRLDSLEIVEGYAELKTGLRGERGGERNHDLLLVGPGGCVRTISTGARKF
jgi:hypothetical protein